MKPFLVDYFFIVVEIKAAKVENVRTTNENEVRHSHRHVRI